MQRKKAVNSDMGEYIVVVGCGIAGSILARRIAEEKNKQILMIEKRNYIGGYCFDYWDEVGGGYFNS